MARSDAAYGAEIVEANEQLLGQQPASAFARLPGRASLALLATGAMAATAFFALKMSTTAALTGSATTRLVDSVSGGAGGASAAPSSISSCPVSGESCMAARCCANPGYQCYKKNPHWASCLKNCTKGAVLKGDLHPTPWDCEEFGPRNMPAGTSIGHAGSTAAASTGSASTPLVAPVSSGAAPITSSYCPVSGEDCTATRCCRDPGYQCYKQNSKWASCLKNCSKGKRLKGNRHSGPWDCEELGPRNLPAGDSIGHKEHEYCALRGLDCRSSTCCSGMLDSCFLKNPEWGSCQPECDPAATLTKGWSCVKLY